MRTRGEVERVRGQAYQSRGKGELCLVAWVGLSGLGPPGVLRSWGRKLGQSVPGLCCAGTHGNGDHPMSKEKIFLVMGTEQCGVVGTARVYWGQVESQAKACRGFPGLSQFWTGTQIWCW